MRRCSLAFSEAVTVNLPRSCDSASRRKRVNSFILSSFAFERSHETARFESGIPCGERHNV